MGVSDYKIDVAVVVVGVVDIWDSVVSLCVYACGEMKSYWYVDELFEIEMLQNGDDVEVFTGRFLKHDGSSWVVCSVLGYGKE